MAETSRILIAELDSPAQAARFTRLGSREAITQLSGMLRVGMLTSRSILVTDAMLLDGEYFMALGPEGVLRELGATQARFPLTITGRDSTLREGLERRLRTTDFRWSLGAVSDGSATDAVRQRWEEWIRFVETGIIPYEHQQNGDAPLRPGPAPVDSPEQLAVLAATGLGDERVRSSAWATIETLDEDQATRARIRSWWNDAYLRMIAENAHADWVSFGGADEAPLVPGTGDGELPLSSELLTWARDSTPSTIALAWDASGSQRRRLHERPSWARMRDLAFAATRVVSAPSRRGVIAGSIVKLVIAVIVVALAAPGLQIGSIDSPWTWIAFIGVIATTVPFDALFALLGLLRRDPRARLVLYRAGERA